MGGRGKQAAEAAPRGRRGGCLVTKTLCAAILESLKNTVPDVSTSPTVEDGQVNRQTDVHDTEATNPGAWKEPQVNKDIRQLPERIGAMSPLDKPPSLSWPPLELYFCSLYLQGYYFSS